MSSTFKKMQDVYDAIECIVNDLNREETEMFQMSLKLKMQNHVNSKKR